ncbi:M15 family metallopeptidase [Pannus brasiliensis CCIBt3594]|uniref:M15 family metallopeptidase n=1 Tax=Pannus brasiliensis CCIBt3594 TaxID=1427578 RepID=A0AAW9QQP4_9CHRO
MKPIDDIPEALRDNQNKKSANPSKVLAIGSGFLALAGVIAIGIALVGRSSKTPTVAASPTVSPSSSPVENILGHLPYKEAPASELAPITANGQLFMRKSAARSFLAMRDSARRAGVILVPISAFRSKADQERLFFKVKAQRNQETRKRAEVSAPPGYSEHHTGYAIDIGDGRTPATNLNPNFENTAAFNWLKNNAAQFSFELSFPRDNPQGISYEPWHWRYVGDSDSLETFYKAQQLRKEK